MKIATLNIDWAQTYKLNKNSFKNKKSQIEEFLSQQDFDFLILTEAVFINLENFKYVYFSEQIPENVVYENLNYSEYLHDEKAYRTIIYSKIPFKNKYEVSDNKTSLALEFETEFGNIVIYATIIGTWFNKLPFAKNELDNCIDDCTKIFNSNQNLFIIGDLNTSFLESERQYSINSKTTFELEKLFSQLNLKIATKSIAKNIDHIIIPKYFESKLIRTNFFVEKGILSDHQGVYIEILST